MLQCFTVLNTTKFLRKELEPPRKRCTGFLSKKMKYIASCSFGKDSMAQIILARENGEPIDMILYCEVMYDAENNISGETPEHRDFIYNRAIPVLKSWGYNTTVVRSRMDYKKCFFHVIKNSKDPEWV